MIINIGTLIKQEQKVIESSLEEYRSLVTNTDNLINILKDIVKIKNREAAAYYFLVNQLQNGLYQCLLSMLRRHEVQAQLILRHSVEIACLTIYSLHNTKIEKFITKDNIGAKPVQNVLKESYKWLDKKYSQESKQLKLLKDQINEYYAHGNMFNSFKTVNINKKSIDFFDKKDTLMEKIFIWKIGFVASISFKLIYNESKESTVVETVENTFKRFIPLLEKNQKFREIFMNEERFKKWDDFT